MYVTQLIIVIYFVSVVCLITCLKKDRKYDSGTKQSLCFIIGMLKDKSHEKPKTINELVL